MVDCDYFECIEWDEESGEVYNAMCSRPSPCWPNCGSCVDRKPYIEAPGSTVCMQRWLLGKNIVLTRGDVDILDGSRSRHVRIDPDMDTEVKKLYDMYKSL